MHSKPSIQTFHTSWRNLPLNFLIKEGFKFKSYPREGTDIFSKRIGDYNVVVEDWGNQPHISINGVMICDLNKSSVTKREFINIVKSVLKNPEKYVNNMKIYLVQDSLFYPYQDFFFKHHSDIRKKRYVKFNMYGFKKEMTTKLLVDEEMLEESLLKYFNYVPQIVAKKPEVLLQFLASNFVYKYIKV